MLLNWCAWLCPDTGVPLLQQSAVEIEKEVPRQAAPKRSVVTSDLAGEQSTILPNTAGPAGKVHRGRNGHRALLLVGISESR